MPRRLPVFPLGTVLLPGAVLPLHIFEPRYRTLMNDLHETADGEPEMGIVLIERGSEVGGGELRSMLGTVARIVHAEQTPDGRWLVLAEGTDRFMVANWLPDDPYPLAEVEELPPDRWEGEWEDRLKAAEKEVRGALALASELGEARTLEPLPADRIEASWELCAAAPLGPFDRQKLLAAPDAGARLMLLAEQARDAASLIAFRLGRT